MRQRIVIVISIAVVLVVLIALNLANYVGTSQELDSEWKPNRSTYHSGPTGTRALYDLLTESGYTVSRWREPTANLTPERTLRVATFVVVGTTLKPFEDDEAKSLLRWVARGGRLVIIDRKPPAELLPKTGEWSVVAELLEYPPIDIDSGNAQQMTAGVKAALPVQPTVLTRGVEAVMPSRFASMINLSRSTDQTATAQAIEKHSPEGGFAPPAEVTTDEPPTPAPDNEKQAPTLKVTAPVVHISDSRGALLVDYPHGLGRIILLSDPYIVSNGGVNLDDNLQLAINIVAGTPGVIAFDEYHQGRGATHNEFVAYFAGTPVLAICGQLVLILLAMVWTRGRRFARSLPLPQIDRRSSLEFVASMAELQQRARALDLAVENIYSRTRRVLTRYAGMDYHSSRAEIAERVASRSSLQRQNLELLMKTCEVTINGAPVSERQAIQMVRQLREVERALGLRMRSRDLKQR